MTTLVIVAHPDDETLGCGGTIARLTDQGEFVHVCVLGKTRVPRIDLEHATQHLGASFIHDSFPDQRFETEPFLRITQHIEAAIQTLAPETIYTHHGGDLNLDHAITHRAVLTACRPLPDTPVRTIYAFETPSSTEWGLAPFTPNVYVDISATLERKLEAMRIYESEVREYPHPRSTVALKALAQTRGREAGLEAAEAFMLIRSITP